MALHLVAKLIPNFTTDEERFCLYVNILRNWYFYKVRAI